VAKAQKSLFPLFLKGELIMCKKLIKLICLVSFVLALGFVGSANAQAPVRCGYTDKGADHLWTTPENWQCVKPDCNQPPDSFDTTAQCKIDGTICQITDGMDVVCKAFNIARDGCTNEVEISGGTLTYTGGLMIGVGRNGGYGYLKVTGGEINGGWLQIPRQFAEKAGQPYEWVVGHLDLFGGALSCNNLMMGDRVTTDVIGGGTGTIDITEGTLIVKPDETIDTNALLTNIEGFIDNGWITAYGFKSGEIDPTGQVATVNMMYDSGAGQIILTAELRNPNASSKPSPGDGLTVAPPVDGILTLSWMPADTAANHHVYFAADNFDDVNNRDPNAVLSTQAAGDEDVDTLPLALNTQYFWTVDEQDSAATVNPGYVWSFTTPDYLVVDDMESYDNIDVIYETWIDGYDSVTGNGSGAFVGHDIWDVQSLYYQGDIVETSIVQSGTQSMPLYYNNDGSQNNAFYSEATRTFDTPQDWTYQGVEDLSIWFRGWPGYVGSFTEDTPGTYTMTAAGKDLWGNADGLHYAYKQLSGLCEVVAKIDSVDAVHDWTRVGVMIRDTLEPDSTYFATTFAPNKSMVRGQYRDEVGGNTAQSGRADNVSAPIWVKMVRGGNAFTSFYSTDGSSWEQLGDAGEIVMGANVYVGLILSSHDFAKTAKAVFSNVSIAAGPWSDQDIGITTNQQEPLYVALEDSAGNEAVAANDDPNAVLLSEFTEWTVSLQDFGGVDLTSVKKLTLRVGDNAATQAGGQGTVYFDDVRLYLPRPAAEPEAIE